MIPKFMNRGLVRMDVVGSMHMAPKLFKVVGFTPSTHKSIKGGNGK